MISQNRVSATTLVFYWYLWRKNVMDIFKSLGSFRNEEPKEHEGHVDFSLNYFGVRKQCVNGKIVFLLVNKDADWIRNAGHKGVHMDGKRLMFDGRQFVCVIRSYWQSELLSVSIKVLETLENLYKLKSDGSAFHQSTSLIHLCDVSEFLIKCECLNLTSPYKRKLQSFLGISTNNFDLVFPLDWRKSMSKDLISLRNTIPSVFCLLQIILQSFDIKGNLNYRTIGRAMMICLGYRKPMVLHQKISKGLQWNPAWKSFVDAFCLCGLKDAKVVPGFQMVLDDTFTANWRRPGYISPHSFVYLLDSFLFFSSFSSGIFFTTKSSLIGWLTQFDSTDTPSTNLPKSKQTIPDHAVYFIVKVVENILYNENDTVSWIQRSEISPSYYHPLLALKLVIMMSLICLQVSDISRVLLDLLSGRNNIAYLLPEKFVCNLIKRKKGRQLHLNQEVVAEAFISIDDPLVVASSETSKQITDSSCAIFVDLRKSKEEILNVLFRKENTNSVEICSTNVDVGINCEASSSSNTLRDANLNVNPVDGSKKEEQMSLKGFNEVNDAMTEAIRSAYNTSKKEEDGLVDVNILQRVVKTLFENQSDQTISNKVVDNEPQWLNTSLDANLNVNPVDGCNAELNMNWKILEKLSEAISFHEVLQNFSVASLKRELDRNICTLATALENGKSCGRKVTKLVRHALRDLKVLTFTFDMSRQNKGQLASMNSVQGIVERLQGMRPTIDDFLKHSVMSRESKDGKKVVSDSSSTTEIEETVDNNTQDAKNKNEGGNSKGKKSKKSKGKKK